MTTTSQPTDPRRRRSMKRRSPAPHRAEPTATPRADQENRLEIADEVWRAHAFAGFGLRAESVKACIVAGYVTPTPIQDGLIPPAMRGRHVIGLAQTGTGKTAAFLLPLFERLDESRREAQALILAPTRELADQVAQEAAKLALYRPGMTVVTLLGGRGLREQFKALEAGAQICVGTPGRVIDHLQRRTLNTRAVRFLVLDEVDRMFDLGFRDDVRHILRQCRAIEQAIVVSATIDDDVRRLVARHAPNAEEVSVIPRQLTVAECKQGYYTVYGDHKLALLQAVLEEERERIELMLIFTRTKRGADRLHERLSRAGFSTGCIHGDLVQRKREHALERFRSGATPVLIATDVAARGLDIPNVSHIINYDIPENPEDYVHRIGRTARMGRAGKAATFVTPEDGPFLTAIEKLINDIIPEWHAANFEHPRPADFDRAQHDTAPVRPPVAQFPAKGRGNRRYRRN